MKGSATEGPGDPFEDYWTRLADLQGVSLDRLPFIRTTVCHSRVRASYNGGLVVGAKESGHPGRVGERSSPARWRRA